MAWMIPLEVVVSELTATGLNGLPRERRICLLETGWKLACAKRDIDI
jgi:hypothetical protein